MPKKQKLSKKSSKKGGNYGYGDMGMDSYGMNGMNGMDGMYGTNGMGTQGMAVDQRNRTMIQKAIDQLFAIVKKINDYVHSQFHQEGILQNISLDYILKDNQLITSVPEEDRKIKMTDMTYWAIYIGLFFTYYIFTWGILLISIAFLLPSINPVAWIKVKRFFGDDQKYQQVDNIVDIFGLFKINKFILYILIFCLIYVCFAIFLNFSSYVIKDNLYRSRYNRLSILLIGCVLVLIIHWLVYRNYVESLGSIKSEVSKVIYKHINMDYINFLENKKLTDTKCDTARTIEIPFINQSFDIGKCTVDLIDVNNVNNLEEYCKGLLAELRQKVAPSDITTMSVESFKTYKKTIEDIEISYYSLIHDAIMTFSLLLNIKNTKYNVVSGETIDKAFFANQSSLLMTININKNNVYDFSENKCVNRDIDGLNNQSEFMKSICQECETINTEVNQKIIELTGKMSNLIFPMEIGAIIAIFAIVLIYFISYTFDNVKILPKKRSMNNQGFENMNSYGNMQQGYDPYNNTGMPGQYGAPGNMF
jgi:hypothetical protein